MISKVKNVQGNGDWEGKYGKMYSFEYEMEDGTVLKANHKTPDGAFPIGAEVEYEIQRENEYGKSGKVSKPQESGYQNNGGGSRSAETHTHIIRQTCIKAACELYSNTNTDASKCIAAAKMFEHYVLTGELPV